MSAIWRGVFERIADAPPLEALELVAGTHTSHRVRGTGRLRVDVDTVIELDTSAAQEITGFASTTQRGRWSSLEAEWGELFGGDAPGPHVAARLRITRIPDGSAIVVTGRGVTEAHEAGYRDQDVPRVVRIVVATIAADVAPVAEAPPRPPVSIRRIARIDVAILVFAAGLVGYAARAAWYWHRVADARLDVAMVVLIASVLTVALIIAMFALGIHSSTERRSGDWLPTFVGEDHQPIVPAGWAVIGVMIAFVISLLFLILMFFGVEEMARRGLEVRSRAKGGGYTLTALDTFRVQSALYALSTAIVCGFTWLMRRGPASRLRTLLGARAMHWRRLEGTVSRATESPPYSHVNASGPLTRGRNSNTWSKGTGESHPFTIATSDGEVEIGAGAVWASTFSASVTTSSDRLPVTTVTTELPVGARVVVAGRYVSDPGPAMHATGAETLLVFATDAHGPSARVLRLRLAVHGLIGLLALAAVAGAYLIARW